jgi:CUG-BP- and ETR3-like factor
LQYGDVKDIIILKDKVSNQPRGCAFVSYATKEEAEAAIHALDKGVHLPGALCPMEVSFTGLVEFVLMKT